MAILAFAVLASAASLPEPQARIAHRIAAESRPQCRARQPDASGAPCLPSFALEPGGRVNARARGQAIAFTRAATRRLTPSEFALLAGHEIAHTLLGHTRSTPASELAADRLGAELACRAGFDPQAGLGLFRHLRAGSTHPERRAREAAVREVACAARPPRMALPAWAGAGTGADERSH